MPVVLGETLQDIEFAGLIIDRPAELMVPGLPLLCGSFDQFEVGSVVIGAADYFRQVGGRRALAGMVPCSKRLTSWPRPRNVKVEAKPKIPAPIIPMRMEDCPFAA